MRTRLVKLLTIATLMSACVQAPVIKPGDYALLKSNYPVVAINGVNVEPSYRLDIPAGDSTAVIDYRTYRHDYRCSFVWTARARAVYEVTDQENKYPLTMYRWRRVNAAWAARHDPLDPTQCIEK